MRWDQCGACFFGGAFLVNAIPHFVSGVMGHTFPSPFAPAGEGVSPAWVNVLWASTNFVFAYLLLARVGKFEFRSWLHVLGAARAVWRRRCCSQSSMGAAMAVCEETIKSIAPSKVWEQSTEGTADAALLLGGRGLNTITEEEKGKA